MISLIIGIATIAGGIGFTVWFHNSGADGGETYFIYWGLPVVGLGLVIRAIWQRAKTNQTAPVSERSWIDGGY